MTTSALVVAVLLQRLEAAEDNALDREFNVDRSHAIDWLTVAYERALDQLQGFARTGGVS